MLDKNDALNKIPPINVSEKSAYQKQAQYSKRQLLKRTRSLKKLRNLQPSPEDPPVANKDKPFSKNIITIPCHHRNCECAIVMECPHCNRGALHVDEEEQILRCDICYGLVKDVCCGNKHLQRISYLAEKQRHFKMLHQNAEGHHFFVTIGIIALFTISIAFIIKVLGPLGGY